VAGQLALRIGRHGPGLEPSWSPPASPPVPARFLAALPGLKLPEQCFLVGLRLDVSGGWVLLQECLKAFVAFTGSTPWFVEPLLCER